MKTESNIKWVLLLSLIGGFWICAGVSAEMTLRCQNRIVSVGDTKAEVIEKCGKPDHIECWEEGRNSYISQLYDFEKDRYQAPNVIKGPILMEHWIYDPSPSSLKRFMHFQNGKLIKIETGEN